MSEDEKKSYSPEDKDDIVKLLFVYFREILLVLEENVVTVEEFKTIVSGETYELLEILNFKNRLLDVTKETKQMPKGIQGVFDGSNPTPDESKHYLCYYCEEEIAYATVTQIGTGYSTKIWLHVETKDPNCKTIATPSTLEVETQTE